MCGVKIEKRSVKAKMKQNVAWGFFSPWIFEPSHNNNVGQKTTMMSGVPVPARWRNGIERTVIMLARSATLLLNQRFSNRIIKKPRAIATMMLGNLIANVVIPNERIMNFWRK